MKLLIDFFPIVLFFICYKFIGIYAATMAAMIFSIAHVGVCWFRYRYLEKVQLLSLLIILILGGATLFFHNPMFIKWKPTGVYWLCAVLFLGSLWVSDKSLVQRMMDSSVCLPEAICRRLTAAWGVFFGGMGALNLYVVYNYNTDVWVTFKLFGGIGLILIFVLLQSLYVTKQLSERK